ncbi:predicted protein [Postia placenta Mad-698-R]|nr:predicted protein [Postia placenta Mad-698-R]
MASEAELISLTKYTLYGVMVTQTFFYYSTYSRDQMWIKIYATAISVFETEEAMAGIIAMQVQLFYAWRLHKLGAIAAIGTSINIGIKPIITNFAHYKAIVIVWLVSSTVADVAVAFALTWRLYVRLQWKIVMVLIKVLLVTMSNGLLIAAFALADMIAFLATCSYGNSAMTTLNSRAISFSSVDNPKAIRMSSVQVVVNVETHEIVDAPTGRVNTDDEEWTHSESEVTETKVLAI